ncbi:hypothetical protein AUP68_14068 [Ilyonectria robusta]
MDINALNPTDTLTFADINIGISNLLTCLEMVPLSIFFLYAYSWNPYLIHNLPSLAQGQQSRYHGGIIGVRAYVDMINPREIVDAIAFAFTMNSRDSRLAKMRAEEDSLLPEYTALEGQYQRRGG